MSVPIRSIRLQKRSSRSLDTLSGSAGEIFFDSDRNALRLYIANQSDNVILADRTWVAENTFSGNYNDLTNKPTIVTDYNQLTGRPTLSTVATTGNYSDLIGAPDLSGINLSSINSIGDVDTVTSPLSIGQVLGWNGTNWVNTTVSVFEDTDTTYALSGVAGASGAVITLTDIDGNQTTASLVPGNNIGIAITAVNEITISNTASYTLSDLTDVSLSTLTDGQVLGYSGGTWTNVPQGGGVALNDFSVSTNTASGSGSLSYDDSTGVFTFTPPNLSSYASLTGFSVTTNTAQGGGSLSYNNTSGVFTFRPADVGGLASLSDFSIVTNTASGGGSLSYNNTTGQFTFTPPDLSGATADLVDDTTPQLGGDLDLNGNNIAGTGNINISGDVAATSFVSSGVGSPTFTSASTITLTAPDGVTITDGTDNVVINAGYITAEGLDVVTTITAQSGINIGQFTGVFWKSGTTTQGGINYDSTGTQGLRFYTGSNLVTPALSLDTSGRFIGLKGTTEVLDTKTSATGTVVHDFATSAIWYHSSITSDFTANFTNVPITNDRAITVALVLVQGSTPYISSAVQINGTASTIFWQGGSVPNGVSNGTDIISFTLIRVSNTWRVIGSLTSYS